MLLRLLQWLLQDPVLAAGVWDKLGLLYTEVLREGEGEAQGDLRWTLCDASDPEQIMYDLPLLTRLLEAAGVEFENTPLYV